MKTEDTPLSIIIIGPDTPKDDRGLFDASLHRSIICGDGESDVDPNDITVNLQKSQQTTHIHYWTHGEVVRGIHFGLLTHDKISATGSILKKDATIPGIRHIWGCYAGAAKDTVTVLGEGSPLICHGSHKYPTYMSINAEGILRMHQACLEMDQQTPYTLNAYDAFELSFLTSPETVVFSELVSGEVKSFTAKAPKCYPGNKLKDYLENKLKEFREFRQNVLGQNVSTLLNIPPLLTEENQQRYLGQAFLTNIYHSKVEAVRSYIKSGVNLNYPLHDGTTPLIAACGEGLTAIVAELLAHGIDINQSDNDGITPLLEACVNGNTMIVKKLLEAGADPNKPANNGDIPLLEAYINGDKTIIKKLLEAGADLSKADERGLTPLMFACTSDNFTLVKNLLHYGADPKKCENNGFNALHIACQEDNPDIVNILLEKLDINSITANGSTPFYQACQCGHTDIITILVNRGADITKGMYNSFTPLMVAALVGQEEVVDILLNHPATTYRYINKIANEREALRFVDHAGIEIPEHHQTLFGKTALEMARENGYDTIVEKIEAKSSALLEKQFTTNVQRSKSAVRRLEF